MKTRLLKRFAFLALLLAGHAQAAQSVTFYHHDALGSVIAKSDADGYLYLNEEYQPYGEKIYATEDFFGGSDDWYTGKNYSEELDLTYFGARWYDAKQGRFLSVDPAPVSLLSMHSFNRYHYANNNPYKYVDPNGEDAYLVSRPLNIMNGLPGNHNFIVYNARYVGDPGATVISFGDIGGGADTTGRVDENTKGFSEGTSTTDRLAWESLSKKDTKTTFRRIGIEDSIVGNIAGSLLEDTSYSIYPELETNTTNSNTAAGAIANRADGGSSKVNNGRRQPGSSVIDRINFRLDEQ